MNSELNKQIVAFSKQFNFSEAEFSILMQKRIYKILIICSHYDYFMLEEDGRIDEQIFNEYVSLNLRYPPIFIQANTSTEAMDILQRENIDLVITMLSVGELDAFEVSGQIKALYPHVPIVVLTHFSREVSIKLEKEDLSAIDYVFSWMGRTDLLLAIIKLIEDQMNVTHDVKEVGVQAILLVEDSIRYYSSYLPIMYKIVFMQSVSFMKEGQNEHKRTLRMRGRPKILLATDFEQAVEYYNAYKENILGVISDISYKRNGQKDTEAGLRFCKLVRGDDAHMPFLLQSSELSNQAKAHEMGASFIHKYSKSLEIELRNFMVRHMAFGDFVFRDLHTNEEISRVSDLRELQHVIMKIPEDVLKYHFDNNDFSRWLNARAFYQIAAHLRTKSLDEFASANVAREYIYEVISRYRIAKAQGVISNFDRKRFDEYTLFSRIGEGALGGKARGLAFIDSFIKQNQLINRWEGILVTIPRTVVLSTEIFEEFMDLNNLWRVSSSKLTDEQILQVFVTATLPVRIFDDLESFIKVARGPIAVRSSSLLEDSYFQPFAGVYSTFMIPKTESDRKRMMVMITGAIKSVYASVYFKSSRDYMTATQNLIDAERMAIILQEVCGARYGNRFYPTISGVARSINFYPVGQEKYNDGIARIAFGLGRMVVEGGTSLRFSPKYPKKVYQLATPESSLRETQKEFYALDLFNESFHPSTDDGINIKKLRLSDAEKDGALKLVASTYDFENGVIRDGFQQTGKKVLTFSQVLKHDVFPLAEILQDILMTGKREMNSEIEIEFAVNMDVPRGSPMVFSLLQIRPIVEQNDRSNINLDKIEHNETIICSASALGNGLIEGIRDFVYVKPECFRSADSRSIAEDIEKLNESFISKNINYVLVGPGRWGSSDPWLGIPVKWSQISAARLIVESGLPDYRVDPSQGTHFFQNITSFRVGYFTINPYIKDGFYNLEFLSRCHAEYEDQYLRHIRFTDEITIKIDGSKSRGVIFKPDFDELGTENP
ncbi:MAG: phosphoenolpyruvate synthase [Bacteroidales bacterium]|nr:phosphoenolpyruvate synthase [Bacteroidales bacterium]